jgi:hypothetical protein
VQIDNIKTLIDKITKRKMILNNKENKITINTTEYMDMLKMSKFKLLEKCEELGITKCSSKKKSELINLINSKTIIENKYEISTFQMHANHVNPTINVISLFSGMGGMDVGFAEQVIVHSESISLDDFINSPYTINGFVNLKRLPFKIVFQINI